MRVGGGDQADLEGVGADLFLLDQPDLHRIAHERLRWIGERRIAPVLEDAETLRQLEAALLVRRVRSRPALGVALVLVDLHEGLVRRAFSRVETGQRAPVGVLEQEHLPATDVGVVRDGQPIASQPHVLAARPQSPPHVLRLRLFDVGDGQLGHGGVPEDHVAMQIRARRYGRRCGRAGPLVSDEGGEPAARGPVVELLGDVLCLFPHHRGTRQAVRRRIAADGRWVEGLRIEHDGNQDAEEDLQDQIGISGGGRLADGDALCAVEAGKSRHETDVVYTEPLRMVRDGVEVERSPQPERAGADTVRIVGRQPDLFAPREIVRFGGRPQHVEDDRVDGARRVHVEVPEERGPREGEVVAVLARLGALPRRRCAHARVCRADLPFPTARAAAEARPVAARSAVEERAGAVGGSNDTLVALPGRESRFAPFDCRTVASAPGGRCSECCPRDRCQEKDEPTPRDEVVHDPSERQVEPCAGRLALLRLILP